MKKLLSGIGLCIVIASTALPVFAGSKSNIESKRVVVKESIMTVPVRCGTGC